MTTERNNFGLKDDDVYTLLGHAEVLRCDGQKDMPAYFMELAEKIALVIGDVNLANRVIQMAKATGAA